MAAMVHYRLVSTSTDIASMGLTADQDRLSRIFMPYALKRQAVARDNGTRFVHYTDANAAMKILQSRELWMRKSSCMNDFMEIEHGLECLTKTYNGKVGDKFKAALEGIFKGVYLEVEELFRGWALAIRTDTYFTCVSEHLDEEDSIGRLSMWRAYGEATGVALVINNTAFLSESNALKVTSSPVAYLSDAKFEQKFEEIADGIGEHSEFLRAQDRTTIRDYVFHMFRFAALCTKHPGFKEELEWRVVYTPTLDRSDRLIKDIQVIGGTPQPIYKIPLRNVIEEDFRGAEIPELIDRIIIGPTRYPLAAYEAFVQLLGEAGVEDPQNRVFVSNIPLRR